MTVCRGHMKHATPGQVEELPALVLAWQGRWVTYKGPHTRAAMTAFGEAHLSPACTDLRTQHGLEAALARHAANEDNAGLLLIGFFDDESSEEVALLLRVRARRE